MTFLSNLPGANELLQPKQNKAVCIFYGMYSKQWQIQQHEEIWVQFAYENDT